MRYLGLDLGTRTLGLSLSDTTFTIASTLKTIRFNENDYEFLSKYVPIWAEEEHIDSKYSINMKLFKKINTIIKGNAFSILENKDKTSYCKYIIKLENTKTNEVGYMLPMCKF